MKLVNALYMLRLGAVTTMLDGRDAVLHTPLENDSIGIPSVLDRHVAQDDACFHNVRHVFLTPKTERSCQYRVLGLQYSECSLDIFSRRFLCCSKKTSGTLVSINMI